MKPEFYKKTLLAGCACLALSQVSALAQDADVVEQEATRALDTVTVTAQRRAEDLQ